MIETEKKLAKLVGLEEQQTIVIDGAGINPEIYKYSLEQDLMSLLYCLLVVCCGVKDWAI